MGPIPVAMMPLLDIDKDMEKDASYWIENLNLEPHPEGGFFKRTYRSGLEMEYLGNNLPVSSAIMYLLDSKGFSAFHRLNVDEIWHFYYGDPIIIYLLHPSFGFQQTVLGDTGSGLPQFQFTVKKGIWMAAATLNERFTLVGCTLAPSFSFDGFELAKREELIQEFPGHQSVIKKYTRE